MRYFSDVAGYWVSRAQVSNAKMFAMQFADLDLTMLQFGIRLRQKDIAKRVSTVPPVLVKPLEDLERRGLVKRTRTAPDRRVQLVQLTKKGQEIIEKGFEASARAETIMMQGTSAEHKQIVIQCLERIIKNVEAEKKKPTP